jgi:hypothetical protein
MIPSIKEGSLSTIDWSENPGAGQQLTRILARIDSGAAIDEKRGRAMHVSGQAIVLINAAVVASDHAAK